MKYAVLILLAVILITTPVITAAWLTDSGMNADINARAHIHKSYFESGDGSAPTDMTKDADGHYVQSASGPFEIHNEVQLYYLAWLQELGYFNADDDGDGVLDPVYFYLSADLDMSDFILPPIGTQSFEFIGNFDGQGYTVSNLTVTTNDDTLGGNLTDAPLEENEKVIGVGIVGFFGVVGSLDPSTGKVHGLDASGTAGADYTYDSEANEIKNFRLEGVTVVTVESNALIGIAAGYVNGTVDNVAVAASGLTVKSGASPLDTTNLSKGLSDYSIVGFCTEDCKAALRVHAVQTSLPAALQSQYAASESGNAWGGSIDMVGLVYRMLAAFKENQTTIPTSGRYLVSQTIRIDEYTGAQISSDEVYSTANPHGSGTETEQVRYFYTEDAGSYYVQQATKSPPHMYASGHSDGTLNTVTKIVTKAVFGADGKPTGYAQTMAFFLYNGSNYLSLNNTRAEVANAARQDAAVSWCMSSEGYLYYQATDRQYFLNGTESLNVEEQGSTVWTYDSDGHLYYTYQNTTYYLVFDESEWKVISAAYTTGDAGATAGYVIGDGKGNYLRVTGTKTSDFTNTTTVGEASLFTFGTANSLSGTISTKSGNTTVYLRNNNNKLELYSGNTAGYRTSWTNTDGHLSNNGYYIMYDNGWKVLSGNTYFVISDGNGHYLNARYSNNKYSLFVGSNEAEATEWNFSNYSGNGTISVSLNNQTRYLHVTESDNWWTKTYSLDLSDQQQDWSVRTSGTLRNESHNSYYLTFSDSAWSTTTRGTTLQIKALRYGTPIRTNIYRAPLSKANDGMVNIVIRTTEQVPSGPVSYIPITVDGTLAQFQDYATGNSQYFKVADSNTGYIVGGYYCSDGSRYGDVRASGYAITNINASYSNGNITKIYTIDGNVRDTSHETLIYDSSNLNTVTRYQDYKKFSSSLETLKTMLASGGSNVYGIHFMNAPITTEHLITAQKVTINGNVYTDYQLPENSVDFNLKEKGYINFFGGTYYGGRDEGFFSLHQIIRNPADSTDPGYDPYYGPNEIIEIRQIVKVYAYAGDDPQAVYIYEYADGSFSPDKNGTVYANVNALGTAGYNMTPVFDMEWIGNRKPYMSGNEIPQNRIYYFEIPANEGEYALGSVDGANGAYLMYLDISAAAQTVDRVEIVEKFEVRTDDQSVTYPKGVQFVASGTDYTSAIDSATFAIAGNVANSANAPYLFTRTTVNGASTITPSPTTGLTVPFAGPGIVLPNGLDASVKPEHLSTAAIRTVWRVTDNDINQTTKKGSRLVTTVVEENGTWSVTVQFWLLDATTGSAHYGETSTTDPIGTLTYTCAANTAIHQSYIYVPGAEGAPGTWSVFLYGKAAISNVSMSVVSGYSKKLNTEETIPTSLAADSGENVEDTDSLIRLTPGTATTSFHYVAPLQSGSTTAYETVTMDFALPVLNGGIDLMPTTPVESSTATKTITITSAAYDKATLTTTGSRAVTVMNDLTDSDKISIAAYESGLAS